MEDKIEQDEFGNIVGDKVNISIEYKHGKYRGPAIIVKIKPLLTVQFKNGGKLKQIVISNSEIERQ